jgi:cytochrome c biogenesis protein CcmG/thiol:disulfide interchange protein DsbE
MLRYTLAAIALVALCFALAARAPADLTAANSRKAAAEFTLSDSKGAPVKLGSLRGRVVLLDFWATYCDICNVEIPWYIEFENKYKESGLSVVGVSVDEDGWKSVKPFLEEKKVNYRVLLGNWDLAKQFGVDNALPVTLLIDRDGRIADSHTGLVDKGVFESEIKVLLKEIPAKGAPK